MVNGMPEFSDISGAIPFQFDLTVQDKGAIKEARMVKKMEKKMVSRPSREAECRQQLEYVRDTLQQSYERRVAERAEFLRDFYEAMFQLNAKDFTKECRKYCSMKMNLVLQKAFQEEHQGHGYLWAIFTDNMMHGADGIQVSYLEGNPALVENSGYALFMFGDSVKRATPKYRFFNEEDKWYRVALDGQPVYVQVDGQKDYITITGLVNPRLNLMVRNGYPKYMRPRIPWL